MSLPGLELTESSVESQYVPPPPTQINLRPGCEWRFEIAFGATVRVKVCAIDVLLMSCKEGRLGQQWANSRFSRED